MFALPARVVEICWAMYEKYKDLAHGSDNDRRKLTKMIAEQCRFDLGDKWGTKSTSSTAPQSKDGIAYLLVTGNINIWDWQNGTTRKPQVQSGDVPDHANENQYFIKVNPINHLSDVPVPDPLPIPTPNPNPNPPAPVPCKPKHSPAVHVKLAKEIGEILDAPNSPYVGNLAAACEVAGHLLYHVQYLGMSLDDARADARRRAQG